MALQVTHIFDKSNQKREIEGLIEEMENYKIKEGLILTYNQKTEILEKISGQKRKIRVIPIWHWFLGIEE